MAQNTLKIIKKVGFTNATSVCSRDINITDLKRSIYELPRYDCNEISNLYPEISIVNPYKN